MGNTDTPSSTDRPCTVSVTSPIHNSSREASPIRSRADPSVLRRGRCPWRPVWRTWCTTAAATCSYYSTLYSRTRGRGRFRRSAARPASIVLRTPTGAPVHQCSWVRPGTNVSSTQCANPPSHGSIRADGDGAETATSYHYQSTYVATRPS